MSSEIIDGWMDDEKNVGECNELNSSSLAVRETESTQEVDATEEAERVRNVRSTH